MAREEITTQKGYVFFEAASALQKSIRGGDEGGALFWATELDKSGYGEHVFKLLKIIASEDIGLGEIRCALLVESLYRNWLDQRKKKDGMNSEALFLVHAVLLCVRAKKSRMVEITPAASTTTMPMTDGKCRILPWISTRSAASKWDEALNTSSVRGPS